MNITNRNTGANICLPTMQMRYYKTIQGVVVGSPLPNENTSKMKRTAYLLGELAKSCEK